MLDAYKRSTMKIIRDLASLLKSMLIFLLSFFLAIRMISLMNMKREMESIKKSTMNGKVRAFTPSSEPTYTSFSMEKRKKTETAMKTMEPTRSGEKDMTNALFSLFFIKYSPGILQPLQAGEEQASSFQ